MSQAQSEEQLDQAFQQAIAANYAVLTNGFATNNAGTVAYEFFTSDAWSVGAEEETAIGAKAIETLYADFVGAYTFEAKSVSAHRVGDAGWDFAEVTLVSTDGQKEVHPYKVLYVWERIDGKWTCKGQMYVEGSFKGAVAGV
ncbi:MULTISPECIES: nuclear transport factor 2 family protein [unclassified Burkholderia]|uniref:nuclear transport factor 2 family protein n=1 Tax=unclassified Burkholderia TaxID=2613784 RepID=UPI000F5EB978|nr:MULTISPECIES: nuclear transport factor 2 family protein [unclassified Burkholderia]